MNRRRNLRGGVLIDSLIGASLLVLGAVAYYSMVPVTAKSKQMAAQETIAVQIGNRMVEHLLLLKPSSLTASTLISLNLIDAGQTAAPYSFTNLPLDDGWNYSPAKSLPNGSGTMHIEDSDGGSKLVRLVITWDGTGGTRTYTTGTILGGFR